MRKRNAFRILFLILFWEICTIFIVFYDSSVLGFRSEIRAESYSFAQVLISGTIVCLIGATILGTLEVLVLSKILRKQPLGVSLLIKTMIYIVFIIFFTSAGTLYNYSAETHHPMLSAEVFHLYKEHYLGVRLFSTIVYWGIACMLALFILQINDKFGQGVLIDFLLGKYHKPKQEKRVFMFMDLKSSTEFAERLGHIRYSEFIQDCFYDLTDIVTSHDARIYQYVGDEVVLSWAMEKGVENGNCIATFLAYDDVLQSKAEYYKSKYGAVPTFKAGLNSGEVTVAEVGEIKKELAYHGDVINTAARIQETCNRYQKKLLVSEGLKILLQKHSSYDFNSLGGIVLKGKSRSVNIYAVQSDRNG